MNFRSTVFSTVAVAVAFAAVSAAADKIAPPTAKTPPVTLKLTTDTIKTAKYLTASSASGRNRIESKSSLIKLNIGGKIYQAAGWPGANGARLGLDTDGDGIVADSEYRPMAKDGSVTLTAKTENGDLSIRCVDIRINYDAKKNEVTLMSWKVQCLYGWTGEIDSVKIRIVDDNFDGKYGNDGGDAILIGDSEIALPLRYYHKIGDNFYQIQITTDGSSITYREIDFSQMGLVKTPLPSKQLHCLILESGGGAFDIRKCEKTGIPAGTYYLSYGVLGDQKSGLPFFRGNDPPKYDIAPDKINTLRIGPPFQLVFFSKFQKEDKEKKMPNMIGIRHPEYIMGSGGETYGPLKFPNVSNPQTRPAIMIVRGTKSLFQTIMPERDGKVGDYWWRVPNKTSLRDAKVVMAVRTRELGKVVGMRTMKQILFDTPFAPPKTDEPLVATADWKKSKDPLDGAKPDKDPGGADKPDPKDNPTTKPRPPVRPKPEVTSETKAARLLNLARNYIKVKLDDKAVKILRTAVEKYPDTDAGAAAKKLLESMK